MRNRFPVACMAALLGLGAATAAAGDSMSLNAFTPRVEPVLIQVDAHGRITSASPAYALPPALDRLLRKNLAEMISKPATDKHGKPIASQFVMNVALQAIRNDAGGYDTSFRYVSAQPVPMGSWFWSHQDGHRLALVSQDHRQRWLHRAPRDFNAPAWRQTNHMPQPAAMPQPASTPAANPVERNR